MADLDDDDKLNELMKDYAMKPAAQKGKMRGKVCWDDDDSGCVQSSLMPSSTEEEAEEKVAKTYCQWTTGDGRIFMPAAKTRSKLTPGVYEVNMAPQIGLYFEKIPIKVEGLLRFPDTNSDKVVAEIQNFWSKEALFNEYGLIYKRGILLYGPPGSGKSCTVQLIMQDVVRRNGIVIRFDNPEIFVEGMRALKQIESETPIVAIMEDVDSILSDYSESQILNILDGVDQVNKIVFLATTNYPEQLGPRIVNRPSRFDKRFRIGFPNAESRKMYFEHLLAPDGVDLDKKVKELKIDLKRWVKDTDEMSIAHLKELFIAVVILGDKYESAIKTLKSMTEAIVDKDYDSNIGFTIQKQEDYYG